MIVVIGSPLYVPGDDLLPSGADGLPVRIARAAVAAGSRVQLVGCVGDDPAGDAALIALARDGIGHAATRRDPSHPTAALPPVPVTAEPDVETAILDPLEEDPADPDEPTTSLGPFESTPLDGPDLDLALRYLDAFDVVILAERPGPGGREAVTRAAEYVGAACIVLEAAGDPRLTHESGLVIEIEAPVSDPDGDFARTIGSFAAALDAGVDPARAFADAVGLAGWQREPNEPDR